MNTPILKSMQLLLASTILLLTACSGLQSHHYPGEPVAVSEIDPPLESTWLYGDDVYYLRMTGSNTLILAATAWSKEKKEYAVTACPVLISQLGDSYFLNMLEDELYTIFRITAAGDDEVVLFRADKDRLKEDIASGVLKARETDHDIILEGSKEEQDAYILENMDVLFSIDSATIARKVAEKRERQEAEE